ncbi:MAG: radical SAM protein, partial [Thiovulaceae bacterium]|nr:radical SAM protein [Sulfurimonadaceae bacterium]
MKTEIAKSNKIFLCAISNITSGTCKEDCKFCSQSVKYKADIDRYRYQDIDIILDQAKRSRDLGALGFCLVTADKGITDKSLDFVCEVAQAVKKAVPKLHLIACNGTANRKQLEVLKQHGIDAYNHNLETSKEFYP